MFCPMDGSKMEEMGREAYECLTCGIVLRYRRDPQSFEILDDGDGKALDSQPIAKTHDEIDPTGYGAAFRQLRRK